MKMNLKKGFTLIELLVVVAIIGILASVVLASLNSARAKGADAAVKANMSSMRPQAEIYYDTANTYGANATCSTLLFLDPIMTAARTQINTQSGQIAVCNTSADGQKWAISVANLKGGSVGTPTPWCVDNSGHVGASPAVATAGICT